MKRIKMTRETNVTFEDGCNKYLDYCKERNLREGTIKHYRQSYLQFYKYFDKDMLIKDFNESHYKKYVVYLRNTLNNDVTISAYLRDLITTLHFLMKEQYLPHFKMQSIKVDRKHVETYTDEELITLLKKPNLKKCSFIEYQSWVMTNFLFATGIRQRSLLNIQIKDLDFDNSVVYVNVTKNRKPLLVPLSKSLANILTEFLNYRQHKSNQEYLFCNVFGKQLVKSTSYHMLYSYNKSRNVPTTGIHRYRHTFAKQWIINGGNVVTLSKMLGHSSLDITQNYINLLVSDVAKQVEELSLLDKFSARQSLKLNTN